ncbi:50S ribosomal protein L6 [Rhodocyclus tenuis]|uniref:Large ribosomal subunit protein uL6 n=1 Tax=Rhodocyclus gracilis TaxID=2929842 RepID=A0ABX0WFT2_9RHOO|nr:50S ribosomal protein L6 [Rhodocyclus gracilis]MRD74079.1 50S ribosomal protein L6 [Rhodocyclus gracilis]NJA88574.1 50S ribosomal protein L6 [Rhodocyclus gracilis]
MSRVAKNPIALPQGVTAKISAEKISVAGPLGALDFAANSAVDVVLEDGHLLCRPVEGAANADALSGTVRAIVANMVTGVSQGFSRKLTLVGVGYRAQAQGETLNLTLGFSHPVAHKMPAGIKVETPTQTEIIVKGVDKQLVGQVAAEIRAYRKPEPYKGKGVRYADEVIILKETKKK